MIKLERPKRDVRYSPNVLPCQIKHDGPVNASTRYWDPKTQSDGSNTSYFRGRQLRGKVVKLPMGYRGAVVRKTERLIEEPTLEEDTPENDEDVVETETMPARTAVMEEVASFDSITLWGHDALPDDGDDPYARGIEEWIAFATAMHSFDVAEEKINQ